MFLASELLEYKAELTDKQGEEFIMMRRAASIIACFLLVPVVTLLGDSIPPDPTMIIIGGGHSTVITTFPFTATLDEPTCDSLETNGLIPLGQTITEAAVCFDGVNESGVNWTSLHLILPVTPADSGFAFSCNSVFSIFSQNDCPANLPTVTSGTVFLPIDFTGGVIPTLGAGSTISHFIFIADFWRSPPQSVPVSPNIPEPGTMALLLIGIGALLGRRRLSRFRRSDS